MITSLDYVRIFQLLDLTAMTGKISALESKLLLSEIIDAKTIASNYVTMNSEVKVHDLTVDETFSLRLVYQFSPLYGDQVSVLAPFGTALLGMKLNETVSYAVRDGSVRDIKVTEILYQPEANGHYEL